MCSPHFKTQLIKRPLQCYACVTSSPLVNLQDLAYDLQPLDFSVTMGQMIYPRTSSWPDNQYGLAFTFYLMGNIATLPLEQLWHHVMKYVNSGNPTHFFVYRLKTLSGELK